MTEDRLEALTRRILERDAVLQDSANKFDALLFSSPQPIALIDDGGRVMRWNRAMQDLTGWAATQVLGVRLDSFLIPERYVAVHRKGLEHFRITGLSRGYLMREITVPLVTSMGCEVTAGMLVFPLKDFYGQQTFIGYFRSLDSLSTPPHIDILVSEALDIGE